ncbi:MAG: J domain-containing protein [Rudaea sp.]
MDLSYYEVLQVSRKADAEVIEAAYQQLVKRYQALAVNDLVAANHLQLIRQAYQTLRDPKLRAAYDLKLATQSPAPRSAAPRPVSPPRRTQPAERAFRRLPRAAVSVPIVRPKRRWPAWLAGILALVLLLVAATFCFSGTLVSTLLNDSLVQGAGKILGVTRVTPAASPSTAGTPSPLATPVQAPTLVTASDPSVSFVTELVMARSTEGENFTPIDVTDTFAPDSTLHAVVTLTDAPSTAFRSVWYFEDPSDPTASNRKLGEFELTSEGSRNLDFTLKPKTEWNEGTYRVEIYAGAVLARSARFTVARAEGASTPEESIKSYIASTTLARQVSDEVFEPLDETTVFSRDDKIIHLVVGIKDAPLTTGFRVSWLLGEQVIDSTSLTTGGTRNLDFTLTQKSQPWPAADYHVDVYVDGRLERTVYFNIK